MHDLLREHLERYLAGSLPDGDRQAVENHLAACPSCRSEAGTLAASAQAVRLLRPPADLEFEPPPGFYARVMDRIEREREFPFWSLLVDPLFGRRLVFASLLLLAALGGYFAASQPARPSLQHRPEAILAGRQPAPIPTPRFGPDLQRNRSAILAALAAAPDQ